MTDRRSGADDMSAPGERVGRRRRATRGRGSVAEVRHRPGPRLPFRRSTRFDEARGGSGVRRRCAVGRRQPRRAGRPPRPRRRAPRRARSRSLGSLHHEAAGRGHRPLGRAGAGRGRPQGSRPARVPPRPGRRRRRPSQDDRGTARLDDVPRARRLRTPAVDHDRFALRAHRLPHDPRRGSHGAAAGRGHRRRDSRDRGRRGGRQHHPRPPSHRGPGARRPPALVRRAAAAPRRHGGDRHAARRGRAGADRPPAAAPLVERHAAEAAELDARIAQFGERGSGRKLLEERHRRELRRHRTDELRSGLAVLAATIATPCKRQWLPPRGAGGSRRADPPGHRGARRAQPQRTPAAAIAALVAPGHVRPVVRRPPQPPRPRRWDHRRGSDPRRRAPRGPEPPARRRRPPHRCRTARTPTRPPRSESSAPDGPFGDRRTGGRPPPRWSAGSAGRRRRWRPSTTLPTRTPRAARGPLRRAHRSAGSG